MLASRALIAFLSPELSEIIVGLGYSELCELRRIPFGRTMSALHASSQWHRHAGQVSAGSPSDVWREGCYRFVVYPGYAREVLGPTGTRESAVL